MTPNRTYYFTFRHTDRDKTGKSLRGYFVEVMADTMESAKEKFFTKFAKPCLPHPLCWDRVQNEASFVKSFYPNGLLKTIK